MPSCQYIHILLQSSGRFDFIVTYVDGSLLIDGNETLNRVPDYFLVLFLGCLLEFSHSSLECRRPQETALKPISNGRRLWQLTVTSSQLCGQFNICVTSSLQFKVCF